MIEESRDFKASTGHFWFFETGGIIKIIMIKNEAIPLVYGGVIHLKPPLRRSSDVKNWMLFFFASSRV